MSSEPHRRARPGHLRGAEERLRHHRRPDGGADPAHLPLVRDLLRATSRPRSATPSGDTIMQGTQDIAVHVGTLHFTAKAVHRRLRGRHPPGRRVRDQRPVPGRHALQRRAHHPADLRRGRADRLRAGQRPLGRRRRHRSRARSTSTPREHFGEGLRIPPVRLWDGGAYRDDVGRLIVSNTRAPARQRGRPARPGRGDAGRPSARSCGWSTSTASTTVDDGVRRGAGLRRAADPRAHRRAARRRRGRPRTTSTSTPPAARA